jgi:hypothetical protein
VQEDKRQESLAKEKLLKELDTIRLDKSKLEDTIKVSTNDTSPLSCAHIFSVLWGPDPGQTRGLVVLRYGLCLIYFFT